MYHFRVNKIGALVGIAVLAAALYFFFARTKHASSTEPPTTTASGSAPSAPAPSAPGAKAGPVAKVGRISSDERKRLAEQIARARANRPASGGSTGTTPPPALPDSTDDAMLVRTTMKDAMREIIPYLADCYDKGGDKLPAEIKVVGKMVLTGDPDVGTLIDTKELADGEGKPLDPAFDLCLKDAFVSLQMPPLSEGSEVSVTYPFLFAR